MLYLVLVNVTLLLGYILYTAIFRKLTFFQWNRVYLLSMLMLSFLIPIGLYIDLSQHETVMRQLPTIYLGNIVEIPISDVGRQSVGLMDILGRVYWLGVGGSILWLCYRVYDLSFKKKVVDRHASFSFMGRMVLGEEVAHNKTIKAHESVHIQQGHTYDILLVEIVRCLNWFNPILYYYRKELKFQHECIADECCANNKVAYAEMLVAHALHVDEFKLGHGFSNQSFLKKRIMMLFKNKSSKKAKLFYLSVIPAILVMVASTLVFNTSQARDVTQSIENRLQDVSLPIMETALLSENEIREPEVNNQNTETFFQKEERTAEIRHADELVLDPEKLVHTNIIKPQNDTVKIWTSVEIVPEFQGGMTAFREWVGENFSFPQTAIDAGVKGTLEATFVVETDGTLSDIEIIKDLGHGTGEALVDLLTDTPKWSPGIHQGKAVRVKYKLPIHLNLQ